MKTKFKDAVASSGVVQLRVDCYSRLVQAPLWCMGKEQTSTACSRKARPLQRLPHAPAAFGGYGADLRESEAKVTVLKWHLRTRQSASMDGWGQ
jgi:hypothetical protein